MREGGEHASLYTSIYDDSYTSYTSDLPPFPVSLGAGPWQAIVVGGGGGGPQVLRENESLLLPAGLRLLRTLCWLRGGGRLRLNK